MSEEKSEFERWTKDDPKESELQELSELLEKERAENRRLKGLLEDKGRELEYAWKTEQEAASRVRAAEVKAQDQGAEHSRQVASLRRQIHELEEALFRANQRIVQSTNIALLVKLERENENLKHVADKYEEQLADIRLAMRRVL